MYEIVLNPIPNQSFSVTIDNNEYDLEIRTYGKFTFLSIWRGNVNLLNNQRVYGNQPIIMYDYLTDSGDFYFIGDEDPTYENFGKSVQLYYILDTELKDVDG